jgi:hypothetical protein
VNLGGTVHLHGREGPGRPGGSVAYPLLWQGLARGRDGTGEGESGDDGRYSFSPK